MHFFPSIKASTRSLKRTISSSSLRRKRSFKELKLEDVLENRDVHSEILKEFEKYLFLESRNVENLYFIFWFETYVALHASIYIPFSSNSSSPTPPSLSSPTFSLSSYHRSLAASFSQGSETFLNQDGQYALNIPASLDPALLFAEASTPPRTWNRTRSRSGSLNSGVAKRPPSPEMMAPIYEYVKEMLEKSWKHWMYDMEMGYYKKVW